MVKCGPATRKIWKTAKRCLVLLTTVLTAVVGLCLLTDTQFYFDTEDLTPVPVVSVVLPLTVRSQVTGSLPPVILLRATGCSWENDFIQRDMLSRYNVTSFEYTTQRLSQADPLLAKISTSGIPIVLIIRFNDCENAKWMMAMLNPIMTFLMSDESGKARCIHDVMGKSGLPVLRQYSAVKYRYPVYRTVNQFILGNLAGMMDNIPEAKFKNLTKATDRKLKWVFVGGSKNDRVKMANILKPLRPNEVHWSSKTPQQAAELMMEATFVPNGRGWASLECFRVFEASRLGAIPVVVGPTSEIEESFSYHIGYLGKLPPWIYASTWKDALDKMERLYANKPLLLAKQRAVLEFWDLVIEAPRQQINDEYAAFNYTARGT